MAYQQEEILLSQKIFYYLLQKGSLQEAVEHELFRGYAESEAVQELLKSQAQVADCEIERYGSVIYLIPDVDNTVLGYSKRELKEMLCKSTATEKDYYLSQFIILTLLVQFYDGQGSRSKTRDMIKLGTLQNEISDRLKEGARLEEEAEEADTQRRTGSLDYKSMHQAFEALKSDEKTTKAKTTKEGVIYHCLSFLEKQGLIVYIPQDEIIKTTKKLDDLMEMKLLNKTNYQKMMAAMGEQADE